jgi:hypothetical protein
MFNLSLSIDFGLFQTFYLYHDAESEGLEDIPQIQYR